MLLRGLIRNIIMLRCMAPLRHKRLVGTWEITRIWTKVTLLKPVPLLGNKGLHCSPQEVFWPLIFAQATSVFSFDTTDPYEAFRQWSWKRNTVVAKSAGLTLLMLRVWKHKKCQMPTISAVEYTSWLSTETALLCGQKMDTFKPTRTRNWTAV